MPRHVGVLHHHTSFFPPDLYEAVGDVAEIVWVLVDDTGADRDIRQLLRRFGTVVDITSADLDAAADALRDHGLEGIVTFVDRYLVLTAELAHRLGFPYHTPEVAARIADKGRQREALAAAGVAGPRFWSLPAHLGPDAVETTASLARYPAVLKPTHGSGSRGVVAVGSAAELIEVYRPEIDQLLEEYLADDPSADSRFASYLSVESVVSAGHISHVAITGRFPLAEPYRETGNFIPVRADDEARTALFDVTSAAIRALEITSAVIHTEIKLTPDGPRLIELNGRLGGRPPFVLRSVSDVNLFQVACLVALGDNIQFDGLAQCREVGYWRMIQPPLAATSVRAVRGIAELASSPRVDGAVLNRRPGTPIDLSAGTDGAIVTVRGTVTDLDALAETIELIDRTVVIDYEMTPVQGAVDGNSR